MVASLLVSVDEKWWNVSEQACPLLYGLSCFHLYVIQEMEGISGYSKICSVKLELLENILSGYSLNACRLGQV